MNTDGTPNDQADDDAGWEASSREEGLALIDWLRGWARRLNEALGLRVRPLSVQVEAFGPPLGPGWRGGLGRSHPLSFDRRWLLGAAPAGRLVALLRGLLHEWDHLTGGVQAGVQGRTVAGPPLALKTLVFQPFRPRRAGAKCPRSGRPPETIPHEWQLLHGKPSRCPRFHNQEFRAKARTCGVVFDDHGRLREVKPGAFTAVLTANGVKKARLGAPRKRPKRRGRLKKWRYGCSVAWVRRNMLAVCGRCGQRYRRAGKAEG
jgi:hypothetical protein